VGHIEGSIISIGLLAMSELKLRNLDPDLVARLERRAHENDRSPEAELRHILKTEAYRETKQELRESLRQIAERTGGTPQTDSTDLIREDRDNRDPYR
jgi:plasmid stability protein